VNPIVGLWPEVLDNRPRLPCGGCPTLASNRWWGTIAPITLGRWPIAWSDERVRRIYIARLLAAATGHRE
jgi:hypothetical protein